jgi:hypothetical protein
MQIHSVRGVSQQLLLRELLPRKHLAHCAERYKVKGCLAKVDADPASLVASVRKVQCAPPSLDSGISSPVATAR